MTFRRIVAWLTICALLFGRAPAYAQAHDEGLAAGASANAAIRGMVDAPTASSVVPGYTATPPQAALAGRTDLAREAADRLAACAATPADPTCQALRTATDSAGRPKPPVGADDPAVAAASRIARNPSVDLGSLASFYSGCATTEVTTPAHAEARSCLRYPASEGYGCTDRLTVDVARSTSCEPGAWFAHAEAGGIGLDVQCLPDRPDAGQHFRLTGNGTATTFFDVDMAAASPLPREVATAGDRSVYVRDAACSGDGCSLTAMLASNQPGYVCTGGTEPVCTAVPPFVDLLSPCPSGMLSGDSLLTSTFDGTDYASVRLDDHVCYAPAPSPDRAIVASSPQSDNLFWVLGPTRTVLGRMPNPLLGPVSTVSLSYAKPRTTATTTDSWSSQCPAAVSAGRCTAAAERRCVEGPATKIVDGMAVVRDCWAYETAMSCSGGSSAGQCAALADAGCTPTSSTCARTDPVTGACLAFQDQYSCTVPAETVTTAGSCPSNVFCLGSSCFNTSHPNDADFARTVSMLEATREAGVYLDADRMQVFKGEGNHCRDKLLKNCCFSDAAGKGMTNQQVFGTGSKVVYDILMNSENRQFVYQGLSALLTSGGFSGTYTSYGVTVAVNGSALPAGSQVVYASSASAGEGFVVAFDPWSLVIAVIIYVVVSVVMAMLECNEEEGRLALKEGASLCHSVGDYCSSCLRIFGKCVSCLERTTGKCCFNSVIARIVNEQGRAQIGKGWGSGESPDCSGFTVAELQSLDFAAMDLSEFYASLSARMPDLSTLRSQGAAKAATCYYGQGKC